MIIVVLIYCCYHYFSYSYYHHCYYHYPYSSCSYYMPVQWPPRHYCHNAIAVICRDALVQGPPGLIFVAYGNFTSVTTGYGVTTSVPLLPCTSISNVTVPYLVHPSHLACDQQLPPPETCMYTLS